RPARCLGDAARWQLPAARGRGRSRGRRGPVRADAAPWRHAGRRGAARMDLILWRHAEAEDEREGQGDLDRALTGRGEKQSARMAAWLDRLLPAETRILASPALRCQQTAMALGRRFRLREQL